MFHTSTQTHLSQTGLAHLLHHMIVPSHQSSVTEKSLMEKAEMVRTICLAQRISVPVLGVNPLFDHVKLVTHTTPNWAVYNLSHDPLWQTGKFPIPLHHVRRLKRLYRGGIEFDALYVAHELPMDFDHKNDRLELGLIKPSPPKNALQLAQKLGVATDGIVSIFAAAIRKPFQSLVVAGNHASAILRDPILMGAIIQPGVNPDEGVPAVWFLLAAWRW